MNVSDAAQSDDRRAILIALRDRLAPVIDDEQTHPRDLVGLSRRILEITEELDSLDARAEIEAAVQSANVNSTFDPSMI